MSDSWGSLFELADAHEVTVADVRTALDRRRASESGDGDDADGPDPGGAAAATDVEGVDDDA